MSFPPPKFTKGHLNANFQSLDLETGSMYTSTSINPFHYAPQGNRKLIMDAAIKIDEEHNKINWRIVKKDRSKISSMIKGVGRVNTMEEVAMTCANICGIQLAMVDILAGKPLLYQFAWKMIRLIKNKKQKLGSAITLTALRTCPWFSWQKFTSFSCTLHRSHKIQSTLTKLKWAITNSRQRTYPPR